MKREIQRHHHRPNCLLAESQCNRDTSRAAYFFLTEFFPWLASNFSTRSFKDAERAKWGRSFSVRISVYLAFCRFKPIV